MRKKAESDGAGESRLLRNIYVPKKDEVTGNLRRLQSGELHNLFASPNIRVMKLWRIRWTRHVAHMEERRK
jgi:hypothetical protein